MRSSLERAIARLASNRVGMPLDTKAGVEIDTLDMHAVILHHARCEHGIESAGNQYDALRLGDMGSGVRHAFAS